MMAFSWGEKKKKVLLFWGMKLVELLLYITFDGTNYEKVVSAEPP